MKHGEVSISSGNGALSSLVKDWGGFERLVEAMHQSGGVAVERDVKLVGVSGAERQIDVLVRHKQGLYNHLTIIECKYWKRKVTRAQVDALITSVRELGASKGVIFSTVGFQSGALEQANSNNIELFKVRDPTDEEWGKPGRQVDLWLHVVGITMRNVTMRSIYEGLLHFTMPPFSVELDPESPGRHRLLLPLEQEDTLEGLLISVAKKAARTAYVGRPLVFSTGERGILRTLQHVKVETQSRIEIAFHAGKLVIDNISFDLGIEVRQLRIQVDRMGAYEFALCVEDCIKASIATVSRRRDHSETEIGLATEPDSEEKPLENGSLFAVWTKGFLQDIVFSGRKAGDVWEVDAEAEE